MKHRSASSPMLSLTLAILLFSGTASAAAPAPFVPPSDWMSALGQQVLAPGYDGLGRSAAGLAERIDELCGMPGGHNLDAARAAWRQTALQLRHLSALPIGPALETRILRRLDFWPTRPAQIESSLQARAAGTLPDTRIGITARGLPALEYLLFDPDRKRLDTDTTACAYAAWLASDAARELAALQPAWGAWVSSLREADPETDAALLGDAVNILIGGIDTLRLKYLEKAARKPGDATNFDAWRSGGERAHLLAFFDGLRLGLQGRDGVPGLTALMRGRGLLALADQLDSQIEVVSTALQALPAHPAEGEAAVTQAIAALASLQGLIAHDISDRLKVTVGFGDNDGD
ncbi:Peptidase M75, Imelysin [Thauera humireducens]|uniref:imelysin family protein n=1 Tax=Thauera humireducens TaxID=1134435 RepID=UPI002467A477|nr:imelysin family protein [Thauera humireducens]CAH1747768.1 Peptidase M75, Imelysin [Thauera humireducens]